MKKLLFLFSLVLCGCNTNSDGSDTEKYKDEKTPCMKIKEFTYKKHSYIYFKNGYYTSGVVHDPECKYCLDKYD